MGCGNTLFLIGTATGATLFHYIDVITGSTFFGSASLSNAVLKGMGGEGPGKTGPGPDRSAS